MSVLRINALSKRQQLDRETEGRKKKIKSMDAEKYNKLMKQHINSTTICQ
jgi:hypothetical protein